MTDDEDEDPEEDPSEEHGPENEDAKEDESFEDSDETEPFEENETAATPPPPRIGRGCSLHACDLRLEPLSLSLSSLPLAILCLEDQHAHTFALS
ncbi:hypothetical protein Tco_0008022 [Tanacetum coccineum]